jgi:tetrahydrodipicolinate N-succinyltransferase
VSVANRFGVSDTAVRKQAEARGWVEQARLADAEVAANARTQVIRDRSERVADTLRVIDAARVRFAGQLGKGDFRLTGTEFAALVKLESLLEGEARSGSARRSSASS